MIGEYVVVTTDKDKGGVFSGFLVARNSDTIILRQARMVVYWPKENHSVVGLAAIGPQNGARISYACPEIEIFNVTAIMKASDRAKKKFETDLWD